jgi:CubicO group peptidase (beta-lactamase class C family)
MNRDRRRPQEATAAPMPHHLVAVAFSLSLCVPPLAGGALLAQQPGEPREPPKATTPSDANAAGDLGKRLDAALQQALIKSGAPAISAAISIGDKIVWAAGVGERLRGSKQAGNAVDLHTRFQAASISKPIVAMAVMKLVADHKLDLDQVVDALPGGIELPRVGDVGDTPLTLRHLLAHLGGTTVHGFPGYAPNEKLPSLTDILDGKGNTEAVTIDAPVGAQYRYSGGGFLLVQSILVATRKQAFPELMRELVIQPVGMTESAFAQPLPESLWHQAACAHDGEGKAMAHPWYVYPELAAAGMWTTPTDLLRALLAMRTAERGDDGAFLPQKVAQEMLTVQPGGDRYGIGWMVRRQGKRWMYGHSGGNQGFVCDSRLMQMGELVIGFAVMSNSEQELGSTVVPTLLAELQPASGR